jgi:hypothetical protein
MQKNHELIMEKCLKLHGAQVVLSKTVIFAFFIAGM